MAAINNNPVDNLNMQYSSKMAKKQLADKRGGKSSGDVKRGGAYDDAEDISLAHSSAACAAAPRFAYRLAGGTRGDIVNVGGAFMRAQRRAYRASCANVSLLLFMLRRGIARRWAAGIRVRLRRLFLPRSVAGGMRRGKRRWRCHMRVHLDRYLAAAAGGARIATLLPPLLPLPTYTLSPLHILLRCARSASVGRPSRHQQMLAGGAITNGVLRGLCSRLGGVRKMALV